MTAVAESNATAGCWVLVLVPGAVWLVLDAVRRASDRRTRSEVAEDALLRALSVDVQVVV